MNVKSQGIGGEYWGNEHKKRIKRQIKKKVGRGKKTPGNKGEVTTRKANQKRRKRGGGVKEKPGKKGENRISACP